MENALAIPEPVVSSAATQNAAQNSKVVCIDSDGGTVFVNSLGPGHGSCIAQVELKRNSSTTVLGVVKHLIDGKTGKGSLQAVCRKHSKCLCWVSNTENSQLLFEWLAEARVATRDHHLNLGTELKKSIGMKVRS